MTHTDFMTLAITMASGCKPDDPKTTPCVGAVIALGEEVVALACRGKEDHAEKIALDIAYGRGVDLTQAVVYTTLEPCVGGVRRQRNESCADRLIAAKVKKVVVGIHDPNISVCGKGFLRLQEGRIDTELFPSNLAEQIKRLNRDFILAQQRIGVRITSHKNHKDGEFIPIPSGGEIELKGTWTNPPSDGERLCAIVRTGTQWWPQHELKLIPASTNEWSTVINIGQYGLHIIFIGKLNRLGMALFDYYSTVSNVHIRWRADLRRKYSDPHLKLEPSPWIGIELSGSEPPKGIDIEDSICLNVLPPTIPPVTPANQPEGASGSGPRH